MTHQTPIAEDFGDIAARLREITSPPAALRKWGIWNLHAEDWEYVDGAKHFLATPIDGFMPPTAYYTKAEAELEIAEHMNRHVDYRAEPREYPGE